MLEFLKKKKEEIPKEDAYDQQINQNREWGTKVCSEIDRLEDRIALMDFRGMDDWEEENRIDGQVMNFKEASTRKLNDLKESMQNIPAITEADLGRLYTLLTDMEERGVLSFVNVRVESLQHMIEDVFQQRIQELLLEQVPKMLDVLNETLRDVLAYGIQEIWRNADENSSMDEELEILRYNFISKKNRMMVCLKDIEIAKMEEKLADILYEQNRLVEENGAEPELWDREVVSRNNGLSVSEYNLRIALVKEKAIREKRYLNTLNEQNTMKENFLSREELEHMNEVDKERLRKTYAEVAELYEEQMKQLTEQMAIQEEGEDRIDRAVGGQKEIAQQLKARKEKARIREEERQRELERMREEERETELLRESEQTREASTDKTKMLV